MQPRSLLLLAARSGMMPVELGRSGQSMTVQVLSVSGKPGPDGVQGQVQIGKQVVSAFLPANARAGDALTAQVLRSANGQIQMRILDHQRPKEHGTVQREGREPSPRASGVPADNVSRPPQSPSSALPSAQLRADTLPPKLKAVLQEGQQIPVRFTFEQNRPTLHLAGHRMPAAMLSSTPLSYQQISGAGWIVMEVRHLPAGKIMLVPVPERRELPERMRGQAGELLSTQRPEAAKTEVAVHLAAAAEQAEQAAHLPGYGTEVNGPGPAPSNEGEPNASGPLGGHVPLRDGSSVSFSVQPWQGADGRSSERGGSAVVQLHGLNLGEISLHIKVDERSSSVQVFADAPALNTLGERGEQLHQALQERLGRPVQVQLAAHPQQGQLRPVPPQGFNVYG